MGNKSINHCGSRVRFGKTHHLTSALPEYRWQRFYSGTCKFCGMSVNRWQGVRANGWTSALFYIKGSQVEDWLKRVRNDVECDELHDTASEYTHLISSPTDRVYAETIRRG